ncbi:MAG: hypothetical protein HeimC3_33750, partial [Candidatus Heimdallarchaeota archaeon LC_3]
THNFPLFVEESLFFHLLLNNVKYYIDSEIMILIKINNYMNI